MSEPIDKPQDCQGDWSLTVKICPNCQNEPLYRIRLKEGIETFKTHHYECGKCGHMERK